MRATVFLTGDVTCWASRTRVRSGGGGHAEAAD